MKKNYQWYKNITEDERRKIWGKAYLTVDANVLLDLYRYHKETRDQIIKSFDHFKERLWISNQTAKEFFDNRNKVIASSLGDYDSIKKIINDGCSDFFKKIKEKTDGSRVIPDDFFIDFYNSMEKCINDAKSKIDDLTSKNPNYISGEDPILDSIYNYFDGRVGEELSNEKYAENEIEAKRRVEEKIPPGYMDSKKENGGYGDFFMWSEIIEKSKGNGEGPNSIILVTSERKDDWWERHHGKTFGPRIELLKEFYEETKGQRILIYQTDNFLKILAEDLGETVGDNVISDIEDVYRLKEQNPIVKEVSQNPVKASIYKNEGFLNVTVNTATPYFTASGRFNPRLASIPELKAWFIQKPESCPEFTVRSGTGTLYDFNVHARATGGQLLPAGKYIIQYIAEVELEDGDNDLEKEGVIIED